jgi:hypothetical protein
MERVGLDIGRRLEWAAVNHYDTDNPHVHLVVRGLDAYGREVRFPREYFSHRLRERAQELATDLLGLRTDRELELQREREVQLKRLTTLDRQLDRIGDDERVRLRDLAHFQQKERALLVGRLHYLEQLELAQRTAPGHWRLALDWQQTLKELGERGDIIKQLSRAIGGHQHERLNVLELNAETAKARELKGIVRAKGLVDELGDRQYAVVSTPDGAAYYVPLPPRQADLVRERAAIAVQVRHVSRIREIDQVLTDAVGRFGTTLTEDNVGQLGLGQNPPDSGKLRRRLAQLVRDGVVEHSREGWQLPFDLIGTLRQRDVTSPKYEPQIFVSPLALAQQVQYPGAVWLDYVRSLPRAPYGAGPEIEQLIRRRDEAVRQLSIEPDSPSRLHQLAELERQRVFERERSAHGLRSSEPERLQGRLELLAPEPSGRRYAIVHDHDALVVVPASSEHRKLKQQDVEYDRSRSEKERVRSIGPELERGH